MTFSGVSARVRRLTSPDPDAPDTRSGPHLLLWLVRCQTGGQLKALVWGAVHLSAVAFVPFAIGRGVQAVVDHDERRLVVTGALLAALGALIAGSARMLDRSAVTNWITTAARVQRLLARRVAALGALPAQRVATGEAATVSTTDVEKIGWFVEGLSRFCAAIASATAVVTALVVSQPALGPLIALALPLMALVTLPLLPTATRRADAQREKAARATRLAADTVAGLGVLRGIGGEELFMRRYRAASQEVRHAAVHSARMWSLISAVQVAMPGLLLLALVYHGTRAVQNGESTAGQLVTAYGAVLFLLYPLQTFEEVAMAYSFAQPSARRVAHLLSLRRESGGSAEGGERRHSGGEGGTDGGTLYDPLSGLLAPAGLLTAVVCGDPNMSGQLAERLGGHPVAWGEGAGRPPSVLLDGRELDDVPLGVARRAVLVQDKEPVLLSGTLRDLLAVPGSGRVSAGAALEAAQCGDVLDVLARTSPAGTDAPLDAWITERGRSLSGGQRQRLVLARSLIADPRVLVLDEPTSAVDSHTEARIAQELRRIRAGRTTVVFTHSPLLLDRADQVILVTDGRSASSGSHGDLLRTNPRYRAVVAREPGTGEEDPSEATAGPGDTGVVRGRGNQV